MNVKILGRSELEEVPASVKETVHHLFDRHFAYHSGQDAYYEEDGRDFVNVEAKLYHAESYGDESAKNTVSTSFCRRVKVPRLLRSSMSFLVRSIWRIELFSGFFLLFSRRDRHILWCTVQG